MNKTKVVIIGAAGRDFHNFNTYFRDKAEFEVVAFTAAQIPDIDNRKYPASLAGNLYPDGIPIYSQDNLPEIIKKNKVDECVFSYSDVSNEYVMSLSSLVNSAGANFKLLGPEDTMIKSTKPVISITASRTGAGKSQTSREVIQNLMDEDLKVVAVRHPMPYGDLEAQKVQRYAEISDLEKHNCTVEEMEEYEPHVARGNVIYAGVDYEAILREAEKDPKGSDVIVWDGGNNDFSFYKPDLNIVVFDPLRPGHELSYYPSQVNTRMADVAIINKCDSAKPQDIETVVSNIKSVNPNAKIVKCHSVVDLDNPELVTGKRVLVVEDGPTLTHGGMKIGAGIVAARKFGASELVNALPFAVGTIKDTLNKYPHLTECVPAMGYSKKQLADLEETINKTDCDTVVIGTPIDLNRIIHINKPTTRVHYNLKAIERPDLKDIIKEFVTNTVTNKTKDTNQKVQPAKAELER